MSKRTFFIVILLAFLPLAATAQGGSQAIAPRDSMTVEESLTAEVAEKLQTVLKAYFEKKAAGASNAEIDAAAAEFINLVGGLLQTHLTGQKGAFVNAIKSLPPLYHDQFTEVVLSILEQYAGTQSNTFTKNMLNNIIQQIQASNEPVNTIASLFGSLVSDDMFNSLLDWLGSGSLAEAVLGVNGSDLASFMRLFDDTDAFVKLVGSLTFTKQALLALRLDKLEVALGLRVQEPPTRVNIEGLEHFVPARFEIGVNKNPYESDYATILGRLPDILQGGGDLTRMNELLENLKALSRFARGSGHSSTTNPLLFDNTGLVRHAGDFKSTVAFSLIDNVNGKIGSGSAIVNLGTPGNNVSSTNMSVNMIPGSSPIITTATGGSGSWSGDRFSISGISGTSGFGWPLDTTGTFINQSEFGVLDQGGGSVGGSVVIDNKR